MNHAAEIIRAEGLSKEYRQQVVLDRIDMSLHPGDCVVVTGANGAGKTTLLRCLGGLTRPSRGSVIWLDCAHQHHGAITRQLGYVAHEPQLYPRLTVRENLMFAARMNAIETPTERVNRQISECGLLKYQDELLPRISRGMQQRLAIARALIHNPRLLLMDEPFNALDASGRQWLEQAIARCVDRGQCVCFTTHQSEMIRLSYRWARLEAGRITISSPQPATRETAA